jgi:hypothetical protein
MKIDRYLKGVLTVVAAALVAIAVDLWMDHLPPRLAQAQVATPRYEVSVPRAWGKLVSYSDNNLLLEGADGTYRVVDLEGRPPEYPRVKIQFKFVN